MIDSSVLVAAFYRGHPHFAASHKLLLKLADKNCTAALHSMAETYAAITRLPISPRPSPQDAMLYMRSLERFVKWVPASKKIYNAALARSVSLNAPGAKIYDALILITAIESGEKTLYTWNVKDFSMFAQGLNISIRTPE